MRTHRSTHRNIGAAGEQPKRGLKTNAVVFVAGYGRRGGAGGNERASGRQHPRHNNKKKEKKKRKKKVYVRTYVAAGICSKKRHFSIPAAVRTSVVFALHTNRQRGKGVKAVGTTVGWNRLRVLALHRPVA